jgi:toxin ParE1/3/4
MGRLALEDLGNTGELTANDNPENAKRTVRRIWDATQLLTKQPYAGRAGRVPGTRELVISETPFIIPYRVVDDTVQILRDLHAKRKWPNRL